MKKNKPTADSVPGDPVRIIAAVLGIGRAAAVKMALTIDPQTLRKVCERYGEPHAHDAIRALLASGAASVEKGGKDDDHHD